MDKKLRRHVAAYGHATWQCRGVHSCVYLCVCACDERDKLPFQDNAISLISTYVIYMHVFLIFVM